MAYLNIDIDLDDIDTDDLVEEICKRIKISKDSYKSLKDDEIKELKECYADLSKVLLTGEFKGIRIESLDDTMKHEYLAKVFSKYSLREIEVLLPE